MSARNGKPLSGFLSAPSR